MDAFQFGQWFSKRRRIYGWHSQRALIETIRKDPALRALGISEDFLARLEAGHLHYPFRGKTRQRVLALAALLCRTPRDVQLYQRAAGLHDLSPQETELLATLTEQLGGPSSPSPVLLPPRPTHLIGRNRELQHLLHALREEGPGIYIISGMPGVGKSALAAELVHLLATDGNRYRRCFPDGIVALSARGCQGLPGLCTLLQRLLALLSVGQHQSEQTKGTLMLSPMLVSGQTSCSEAEMTTLLDQVRTRLAGKRALLLLDDLESPFPLRQAAEVLLTCGSHQGERLSESCEYLTGSSMLVISRIVPSATALPTHHYHLEPLAPADALALFLTLLGRSAPTLSASELQAAERICSAVGGLPRAIELAATAVGAGISCELLAERLSLHPLDALLDSEGELRRLLAEALTTLPPETRELLLQLAPLMARPFSLAEAADWQQRCTGIGPAGPQSGQAFIAESSSSPQRTLASTAAHLARLVRSSLLDLHPEMDGAAGGGGSAPERRYQVHPLLRAYVQEEWQRRQAALLAFATEQQHDIPALKSRQAELLLTLAQAYQSGQDAVFLQLLQSLLGLLAHLPFSESEPLLLRGLEMSQRAGALFFLACFLQRLGALYFYHGHFQQAHQRFEESLQAAQQALQPGQPLPALNQCSHPRSYLARSRFYQAALASSQGDLALAQRYINIFLRICQECGDVRGTIEALKLQGRYAYRQYRQEEARQALRHAEHLLISQERQLTLPYDRALRLEIQLLLCHTRDDQVEARATLEQLIALASDYLDPYFVPALVLDEADFAWRQGAWELAHLYALRAIREADRLGASFLHQKGLTLLQRLTGDEPRLATRPTRPLQQGD
ncbi:MAG: ATP-binding protein [Thermogemmatispora sp.]|uniref:AAA family ATPase n=1 Tax=Thermogemmatispora sp. TaxID=1968838 RepID=UPI001A00E851|nr:AAA family ATPase [Thermogemmatispora sp.]MBE3566367.1 ATP-binding protein [Thermogemmatispora sp.]